MLSEFLGSQSARGGGDYPEAAGACLNEAIRANWFDTQSNEARAYFDIPNDHKVVGHRDTIKDSGNDYTKITTIPVIVFWTDASISSLSKSREWLSSTTPVTYSNFEVLWENSKIIPQDTKLLIHFGPNSGAGWNNIKHWERYSFGGTLDAGNTVAVKRIAEEIKESTPELVRLLK